MSFTAGKFDIATESQTVTYTGVAPDVCLIIAPPPPAGPKGIPTPFPITTDSSKVDSDGADGVEHDGKKVMNTNTIVKGIQGNNAGISSLPPGKPEKDILTGVEESKAQGIVGCLTVKIGGKPAVMSTCQGMGNIA